MANKECQLFFILLVTICANLDGISARSIDTDGIRSDVIQTHFPGDDDVEVKEPGWMRRQLMRFGNIASRVGDKLGGSAAKVAGFVERLCKMLKTIIPIVAAVCHVGQFQFCSAAGAPTELATALAQPNPLDMNLPD